MWDHLRKGIKNKDLVVKQLLKGPNRGQGKIDIS